MRTELGETSQFISTHLPNASVGWPRVQRRPEKPVLHVARNCARRDAQRPLDVLIVGRLLLQIWSSVEAEKTDAAPLMNSALAARQMIRNWRFGQPSVCGFVVNAGRAARALGCRVHLACTVPAPMPGPFEELFQELDADTTYVTAVPGETPARIDLLCRDGVAHFERPGVQGIAAPRLPLDELDHFDAILVDPGRRPRRATILRALRAGEVRSTRRVTVAIRGREDWDSQEFRALHECGYWLFFNSDQVIKTAARVVPNATVVEPSPCPCPARNALGSCAKVASLGACLKERLGSGRLLVGLGACGTCLLSDAPRVELFPPAPVSRGSASGAGDVLLTVTALSSARGMPDDVSVRRGVAAATGCAAGLPLPAHLEELDA